MLTEKEIEERYKEVMSNEDLLDIINYKSFDDISVDDILTDEDVIKNAEKMFNSPEYNEMVKGAFDLIKADKRI
jgi:hypothetical protein